jgi:ABC-type protease/lipase transport system fused ATPase/permease subunit
VEFEPEMIEKLGKRPAEPGGEKTRDITSLRKFYVKKRPSGTFNLSTWPFFLSLSYILFVLKLTISMWRFTYDYFFSSF